MIDIQSLTKTYHPRGGRPNVVLNNVSITFPTGRNVGVLGLNGAGKSTLIRLLSGTEMPDRGKIVRSGSVSFPLGLATIFHPDLSGRENLEFLARIYDIDFRELYDYVADFSELGAQLNNQTKTYSSGMLAKVAFGACLAINFSVYLIDEITEVGDGRFREKALREFSKRTQSSDIIIVSHNVDTIRQYCDMGAILGGGRIQLYDSIELAIADYRNETLRTPPNGLGPPS
ncbi:ABC transporter ATP-binding protein [Sphingomonas sp. PAMC 26617]|uniref:ABC transporter ATP-binding protein n=1 Tax=Sphingomonas sp. PAMC 26617 TaxID=1112216 RepID=UPI0002892ADE|nr:ATP-binding cassette domain-containing protein [Sphingomonas sp. PAMC 26617]